jgi:hypothetical protein
VNNAYFVASCCLGGSRDLAEERITLGDYCAGADAKLLARDILRSVAACSTIDQRYDDP